MTQTDENHKTAVWVDHKGREILIINMSNRWLHNIARRFKNRRDQGPVKAVMDEIFRRKNKNKIKNYGNNH